MASSITLENRDLGVLTNATSVKLRDSTGAFGIRNNSTGATVVAPTAAITPTSVGIYTYNTSALPAANYTAIWEVIPLVGATTYETHIFTIDASASALFGKTLADLERAAAEWMGPFWGDLDAGAGSDVAFALIPEFISRVDIGDYIDHYLLRRGRNSLGEAIVGFLTADRVRLCEAYDNDTGKLSNDRNWTIAPIAGERVELHYMHPSRELRRAVLTGLAECFFLDRSSVTTTSATAERNLTTSLPWLTSVERLRRIEYTDITATGLVTPMPVAGWAPIQKADGIYARVIGDPFPLTLEVTTLRPHTSYVNGATSVVGPNDDDDVLTVNENYAAAAAIRAAYRISGMRRKLGPPARIGLAWSQREAAAEFTKWSRRAVGQRAAEPWQHRPVMAGAFRIN